jgi:hypothetical protein
MLDNLRARIHSYAFFDLLSSKKNQAFYVYFMLCMATVSDFIAATTSPIQAVQMATAVFCFLWFCLLLFNLQALRVTTSLQIGSLIACLEETVVCFYSGGVYASAMSWFALIVIANYFIAGRRAGFFWLIIVVLMHVLQLYLHDFFDSGVPLGVQNDQALSSFLDYSFMAIALILVLLFSTVCTARLFLICGLANWNWKPPKASWSTPCSCGNTSLPRSAMNCAPR